MFSPLLSSAADALLALACDSDLAMRVEPKVQEPLPRTRLVVSRNTIGQQGSASAGDETLAVFALLWEVHAGVEVGYRGLMAKLAPGPGPPMAWPGGYQSVTAFEIQTGALAAAAS